MKLLKVAVLHVTRVLCLYKLEFLNFYCLVFCNYTLHFIDFILLKQQIEKKCSHRDLLRCGLGLQSKESGSKNIRHPIDGIRAQNCTE